VKFALITFRYSVDTHIGATAGPDALLNSGLADLLRDEGHEILGPLHTELTAEEKMAYGAWNRIGLANAQLARLVFQAIRNQAFPLVLESNCYAALGVLAGLQSSVTQTSAHLGMVWIDAHGDCNTPETTMSGMLSGMPVAMATGMCLHRLRRQAGLDPPIAPHNVVMVCVRANDPLEKELIDNAGVEIVPVADIKGDCRQLQAAMKRLSEAVDLIYVHFDVDALDPSELANLRLTEPDGPRRTELAAAVKMIMAHPKAAAFGVADINPERDVDGQIIQSAFTVIRGAIEGRPSRV
jgi:arginase